MKLTKPLPLWAVQLVWFIYAFCFTGAGLSFVVAKNENLGALLVAIAPTIHALLISFVGEDPKDNENKNVR